MLLVVKGVDLVISPFFRNFQDGVQDFKLRSDTASDISENFV